MVYTIIVRFEWDHAKAKRNYSKQGITFEIAITVFDDPFVLIDRDEKHSTSIEIRGTLIGESDAGVS